MTASAAAVLPSTTLTVEASALTTPVFSPAYSALGQETATIHLTNAGFDPDLLFITVDTTVTLQNDTYQSVILIGTVNVTFQSQYQVYLPLLLNGGTQSVHTPESPTGNLFQATIPPGGNYSYTFNEPGVYDYYRLDNPSIQGRIIVEPEAGENEVEPSPTYDDTVGIYTGPGAIQQGMDPAIIQFDRVAVVRGFVSGHCPLFY